DAGDGRLHLAGRPPVAYDTVSFDVGSTVAGQDVPGVREHAMATRPIGEFVRRAGALIDRARGRDRFDVVVVGAGAGGVEVAFALRARLRREGVASVRVWLLESAPRLLPGYPAATAARALEAARQRSVVLRLGQAAQPGEAGAVA